MMLRILVVDGAPGRAQRLAEALSEFGHRVATAASGADGLTAVAREAFDALVLGADAAGLDGLAMLARVRDGGMAIPVVVLGASARSVDKVEYLEAGADDYVVEPADVPELNARLKALVRARRLQGEAGDTVAAGDIVVSPSRFRAWRGGQALPLARIEFRLLAELVRAGGAVVPKAALIERIWGADFVSQTNVLEAHVRRLRIKLAAHGDDPIRTLRHVGYAIRD